MSYPLIFQVRARQSLFFSAFCLLLSAFALAARADWNIVWDDEFNGTAVDPTHWTYDIGNGGSNPGWGNEELEYYTSLSQNVFVTNGCLNIVAQSQSYDGFSYTSARLKSVGLFSKLYGGFEFRAKVPAGQGYWPALWMLPESSVYGGWAASGEIDVMENKGANPAVVQGTIFYGGPWPTQTSSTKTYTLPNGGQATDFHVYTLQWTNNAISWLVDGVLYETQTSWWSSSTTNTSIQNPYPAPFNEPFYILMNLAVGGDYGGSPNANTVFPGVMQVDYVRVYDVTPPLQISATNSNGTALLSWPTNIVCHLQELTNYVGSNTWTDVTGAANPFTVPGNLNAAAALYRLASP